MSCVSRVSLFSSVSVPRSTSDGSATSKFGFTPVPLKFPLFFVSTVATVSFTAEPPESSCVYYITPLPAVEVPTSCAFDSSRSASANSSPQEAVPEFTITAIGIEIFSASVV